ncbi:hypothetical protein ACLUEY_13475 [Vreelandella aquamarina]|nr:MAG: hypothetical protein XD36_3184 [Halomonas sp. 54_146]HAA44264.1 hypothetical protein [Halomonas sp.]
MKLRVVRSAPELHVALFAFLLNLPWEFLQVPLYVGMPTMPHWQAVQACAQASLGDVLIALTAYWAVSGWRRRRHWLRDYGAKEILGFVLVGVGLTVALEWHATIATQRWAYAPLMPTVEWLGTGLSPLLQWLILPPLILWMARRHLLGSEAVSKHNI